MVKLASYVHLLGEDGTVHTFGPDSTVPRWAEEQITNPDAWDEAPKKRAAKKD